MARHVRSRSRQHADSAVTPLHVGGGAAHRRVFREGVRLVLAEGSTSQAPAGATIKWFWSVRRGDYLLLRRLLGGADEPALYVSSGAGPSRGGWSGPDRA